MHRFAFRVDALIADLSGTRMLACAAREAAEDAHSLSVLPRPGASHIPPMGPVWRLCKAEGCDGAQRRAQGVCGLACQW